MVDGEITFLAQGLLHQHSSPLGGKKPHYNPFPRKGFRTLHDRRSTDEDRMNTRSRLDSPAFSLPTQ